MSNCDLHILTAEAVELLKDMIAIPSPSFSEDEVCTHISKWMSDKGIMHKRVGNNLIARLSEQPGVDSAVFEGKPTLMLCAHMLSRITFLLSWMTSARTSQNRPRTARR